MYYQSPLLPLMCGDRIIPFNIVSLRRQDISTHDIDYVG